MSQTTKPAAESQKPVRPRDFRRMALLAVSLIMLVTSAMLWHLTSSGKLEATSTTDFASASCLRIGLVLGAVWLAWDSLQKPARWLPPGAAVGGLLLLASIAAQPRLGMVLIPAFGGLVILGGFIRSLRGRG